MMLRVIGYELTLARRDRRAWWSLLCLSFLVLLSFGRLCLENSRDDTAKQSVAAAERARWVGQGVKDPHSAAHYSIFAFKPSPALAALDPGVGPFVGQTVWLEAHHQNDMLYRPQQGASPLQRAGLGSPAALILGFSPLVAFLLAFTLVAQDREQGTLRLALGAATHPASIVRAKAVAIWIALTAGLVAPVAVAALAVCAFTGRLDGDVLARLALWAALSSAYMALLAAVGTAAALWSRNARVALAGLFGIWIVFALIAPRAASTMADLMRPLPSSQAIRQQILEEAPAYWSVEDSARHTAQLLARYGVSSLDQIPNARMAELDMVERHSHTVFDRLLGGFYDKVKAQDRLFAALGAVSPTIAAQSLSAALTGGDFTHHLDFVNRAERYRRSLVNQMNADGMAHSSKAGVHRNDARLWKQVPDFTYAAPRLGPAMLTAMPALFAFAAWLTAGWIALGAAAKGLKP